MRTESFPFEDEIEVTRDDVDENGEVVNAIYTPDRHLVHKTHYVITVFKVRPHEYYQEVSTETFLSSYDQPNVITQASKYGEREVERLDQFARTGIHHVARLTRIRWFPVEFHNADGVLVLDCEPLLDYNFARVFTSQKGSSEYKKWVGTKGHLNTSFNDVKLTNVPLSAGRLETPGMPGWATISTTMPGWAK